MRILLIEDDELLAQVLSVHLTTHHYVVDIATDGMTGFDYAQAAPYDLIILDVNLPQLSGIQLCQRLRQNRYAVPILLLTAKGASSDKVMGLDAGADDYVVKPCSVEEISARVRALLRRSSGVETPMLSCGSLCLDPITCEVTCHGQPISLSPKEYRLLELFLRHPQRVFSSHNILEHLWSFEDAPSEATIRSHIKRLRAKLKASGNDEIIDTVHGMGYRLNPPPVSLTPLPSAQPDGTAPVAESGARIAVMALWEQFKPSILERVALLDQAVAALQTGPLPADIQRAAEYTAHKLAGSLAMFGFPAGTYLGRYIEQLLQGNLGHSEITLLTTLLADLHHVLQQPAQSQSLTPLTAQPILPANDPRAIPVKFHLLVVDDDAVLTKQLQTEGTRLGIQVTVAPNPGIARLNLAMNSPDVILLDLVFPEELEDGLTFLAELTMQVPCPPVVLFTSHDNFANRLAATRRGCNRFISKTTPPNHVLSLLQTVVSQSIPTPIKVLVVDGDSVVLDWLHQDLSAWNIHVTPLSTPNHLWQILETTAPDLLILDVDIPEVNGIELCKVIRSDCTWGTLPILFLADCQKPEIIQQIYSAGADDYVSKPFQLSDVITRIFNRLNRHRLLQQCSK